MSERTKAQGRFNRWLCGLFDSEMFTTKELLAMFFPLLLDQFSIHIIGVLSSSLVSSVGQEAIAAVSMVNSMGFLVTAVMFALGAGGGVVIAQAKGSGDEMRLRHAVGNTTMLATGCMIVLSTILYIFAEPVVSVIYPNAEPILKEYAVHYLKLNMLSQVPYAVFHAIFTSFRSVGDSKSSLVLTIFINVSHLLLSLLFINGMGLGVTGSGLSLIVARSVGCVVAVIWIFRPRGILHISVHDFFKWDLSTVRPIIKLGIPFCIEQILFQGGMLMVQGYLSSWGDTPQMGTMALAAHAVASSLMNLYQASANCVTTMTGTVCGQCIGAGKIDLCKRYNRSMIKGGRLVLLITAPPALQPQPRRHGHHLQHSGGGRAAHAHCVVQRIRNAHHAAQRRRCEVHHLCISAGDGGGPRGAGLHFHHCAEPGPCGRVDGHACGMAHPRGADGKALQERQVGELHRRKIQAKACRLTVKTV